MPARSFGPFTSDGIPVPAGAKVQLRVKQTSGVTQNLAKLRFGVAQLEPKGSGGLLLPATGGGGAGDGLNPLETGIAVIGNSATVDFVDLDGTLSTSESLQDAVGPTITRLQGIATLPNGDFVVGWSDGTAAGSRHGAIRCNSGGVVQWDTEFTVAGVTVGGAWAPYDAKYNTANGMVYFKLSSYLVRVDPDTGSHVFMGTGHSAANNQGMDFDYTNERVIYPEGGGSSFRDILALSFLADDTEDPVVLRDENAKIYGMLVSADGTTMWGNRAGSFNAWSTSTGTLIDSEPVTSGHYTSVDSRSLADENHAFLYNALNGTAYKKDLTTLENVWTNTDNAHATTAVNGGICISHREGGGFYYPIPDKIVYVNEAGTAVWTSDDLTHAAASGIALVWAD